MAISITITYPDFPENFDYQPFTFFGKWEKYWLPIIKENNLIVLRDAIENGRILERDDVSPLLTELKMIKTEGEKKKLPKGEFENISDTVDQTIFLLENLDLSIHPQINIG